MLSLFPDMFPGPLAYSLLGTALRSGAWSLDARDIRDHGVGRHRDVDGRPAGGGAGMVLRPDVTAAAIDAARAAHSANLPTIYLSPRGAPFTRDMAADLASGPGAVFLAGRFEGLDQRVIEARDLREVSIGDYVLTGGELAAMVMIDAIVRRLPGVLGNAASLSEESFEQARLEHPQFTKPVTWDGRVIPPVLTSGDHAAVEQWRRDQSEQLTRIRRPDLIDRAADDRDA
ncbi:MAG: tRNA (guanosine(37)-N1)-methyltransferase TrmD [Pseudomonadota bacterium]